MRDRRGWLAGALIAVAYLAMGWVRHTNYWSGALDLGVFDQAAWRLSRGHVDVSLIGRSIFADHLSMVMVLFAPLYRIAATPAWLLGAQAVALGATVLPVRALARDLGASELLATILVAGSGPLAAAAIFDFHPTTMATPFIALACLAVKRDAPLLALGAIGGVLLCRADLGIVLLALALVAGRRTRWWFAAMGIAGLVAGYVIPDLLGNPGTWEPYYRHLGETPIDGALHPWRTLDALATGDDLTMLVAWLLPVGFLTVLRPRWFAALMVAALPVLVSGWAGTSLPWFHYGAPIAPLAIAGALEAVAMGNRLLPSLRPEQRLALPIAGIAMGLVLFSPVSPRAPGSLQLWRVLKEEEGVDVAAAVARVRDGDSVSAASRALPHVTHRDEVYLFPIPFAAPEDTYPPGLEPDASAEEAAGVDVVIRRSRLGEPPAPDGFEEDERVDGFVVERRS